MLNGGDNSVGRGVDDVPVGVHPVLIELRVRKVGGNGDVAPRRSVGRFLRHALGELGAAYFVVSHIQPFMRVALEAVGVAFFVFVGFNLRECLVERDIPCRCRARDGETAPRAHGRDRLISCSPSSLLLL